MAAHAHTTVNRIKRKSLRRSAGESQSQSIRQFAKRTETREKTVACCLVSSRVLGSPSPTLGF